MESQNMYLPNAFDNDDILESDDEEKLPKGVAEGLSYNPRRILVEGWLHKKGTGKDWLGSRSWKPRWARLVVSTEVYFSAKFVVHYLTKEYALKYFSHDIAYNCTVIYIIIIKLKDGKPTRL